jgi:transposase
MLTGFFPLAIRPAGHDQRWTGPVSSRLPHGGRYHAIQALPGIGPVLAAVIVAEIGNITRFATLARLCSAGD